MHLSSVELDPAAPRDALWREGTYTVHQLVWSWMSRSPEDKRGFLYRVEGREDGVRVLVLAPDPPQPGSGWRVDTRPFAPRLRVGDRLAFMGRLNPTVRRAADGRRHDVVMDLKRKLIERGEPLPERAALERDAVAAWLQAREARGGFALQADQLRVDGYQRVHFNRRGAHVDFHAVEVQGLLSVIEPELVVSLLTKGLGSARGFGCGLLLARRA